MVLEKITYFVGKKKRTINVKKVSVFSTGLLFRKNSPALLFSLKTKRIFSIFSIFCKPFTAICLDEKMRTTKIVDVKTWKFKISGKGMHLLEIPITTKK